MATMKNHLLVMIMSRAFLSCPLLSWSTSPQEASPYSQLWSISHLPSNIVFIRWCSSSWSTMLEKLDPDTSREVELVITEAINLAIRILERTHRPNVSATTPYSLAFLIIINLGCSASFPYLSWSHCSFNLGVPPSCDWFSFFAWHH